MNRIVITREVFEKYCYSATNCNNHVFEAVEPRIEIVQEELFRDNLVPGLAHYPKKYAGLSLLFSNFSPLRAAYDVESR